MKKLLALLLALSMVFAMVACGGNNTANSGTTNNGANTGDTGDTGDADQLHFVYVSPLLATPSG